MTQLDTICTVIVAIECVRLVYFLSKVSRTFQIYADTVMMTLVTYNIFIVDLGLIFIALLLSMYSIFSSELSHYKTLLDSIFSTASFCVRDPNLTEALFKAKPAATLVFQIIMILVFVFLVSNIFITLVMIQFDKATDLVAQESKT